MKHSPLAAILALATVSLSSSVFAQPSPSSAQARTAHQDTEFLKKANQGSVNEVNLAKYVLTKTTDEDVKQFAEQMVKDHSKLLEDMKPFDQEAGLTVPDNSDLATDALKAKLAILSGKSFDKGYIKAMIEDHQKDLSDFRKEESATGYPAFKAAVGKGATVVKGHLEMINGIAKKNGVTPGTATGM